MPALKYRVMLMDDERAALEALVTKGKSAARTQTRARILLKAADGWSDAAIMAALNVSATMVMKTRQRCVEDGVEAALKDRPRPGQKRKLTDRQAAHVIAIACSEAPEGHDHWTLRLLADQVVKLQYADSCSYETVRQLLKKHPQALATAGMVHSRGQRGVRRRHGGRAGSVRSTL